MQTLIKSWVSLDKGAPPLSINLIRPKIRYLYLWPSCWQLYLSPRESLSHLDFYNLFFLAFSAANLRKSSYCVLVKLSGRASMLFYQSWGVCNNLTVYEKAKFSAIITLLSNNDPRGEQIVASETVIDMVAGSNNTKRRDVLKVIYWWVGITIHQNLHLCPMFTKNEQEIRVAGFYGRFYLLPRSHCNSSV